jgi:hydroxymethylpyrimidine pyrophosphatase-like HAD family hydrolase
MPQPCYSALALDIDGTITTADARVVYGLVQEARQAGSHVAINTARPQLHCSMSGWAELAY